MEKLFLLVLGCEGLKQPGSTVTWEVKTYSVEQIVILN